MFLSLTWTSSIPRLTKKNGDQCYYILAIYKFGNLVFRLSNGRNICELVNYLGLWFSFTNTIFSLNHEKLRIFFWNIPNFGPEFWDWHFRDFNTENFRIYIFGISGPQNSEFSIFWDFRIPIPILVCAKVGD